MNELSKSNIIKANREKKINKRILIISVIFLIIHYAIIFYLWKFILKEQDFPLLILIYVLSIIGVFFLIYYIEKKIKERERKRRARRFR